MKADPVIIIGVAIIAFFFLKVFPAGCAVHHELNRAEPILKAIDAMEAPAHAVRRTRSDQ